MKTFTIAAALAAAAITAALMLATPAPAQTLPGGGFQVEEDIAHAGADSLTLRDLSAPYESVTLTAGPPPVIDGRIDVSDALLAVLTLIGSALGVWVSAALRAFLAGKIEASAAELLVRGTEAAINYGINATKDAVRDRPLTIEVGNEVLERALEYGVRLFPDLIARFGGTDAQRQRIMARLNLEATARIAAPKPLAEAIVPAG